MATSMIEKPQIVSREEWLAAREKLLVDEKRLTRERDALAAEPCNPCSGDSQSPSRGKRAEAAMGAVWICSRSKRCAPTPTMAARMMKFSI